MQFVKESEGRGERAKDEDEPKQLIHFSHVAVGAAASFIAGLVIVLIVQVIYRSY